MLVHAAPQLGERDEIIVVGDGPVPLARAAVEFLDWPNIRYVHTPERTRNMGCSQWDLGIAEARGNYVMFIGDDDTHTDSAFAIVRSAVKPPCAHVFSMLHAGRVLRGSTAMCEVSNQQVVVPTEIARKHRYADCPEGDLLVSDWIWIDKVVREIGVVFHDEIICVLEKQHFGNMV